MSLTQEQLEQRLNYITGTDAGTICRVNPWGNIIDLWKQKTRLAPIEQKFSLALKMGSLLEPVVAQLFEEAAHQKLTVVDELLVHKTIPYMAANVDRMVQGRNEVVELKTARMPNGEWGDVGENLIPSQYLCQIYHYAMVTDAERMHVGVLFKATDEFRKYSFERNERLESIILEKEKLFWECVQTMTAPEPDNGDEVMSLYGTDVLEDMVVASGDVEIAVGKLKAVKTHIKELEESQKELESVIKAAMGNKTILMGQQRRLATWNVCSGRTLLDSKKLENDYPEAYDSCLKKSPDYRMLLIK